MSSTEYSVRETATGIRVIKDYTGSPTTVSVDMTFSTYNPDTYPVQDRNSASGTVSDYVGVSQSTVADTPYVPDETWDKTAYVWVKEANPVNSYSYTVTINTEAPYTVTGTDTKTVCDNIVANVPSGYTAVRKGSVVQIQLSTGGGIDSFNVSDTFGDQAAIGWVGSVSRIEELPSKMGFDGTIVHITGSESNNFDDYYVEFDGNTWSETVKPNLINFIDGSTMPHILRRVSQNEFVFEAISYDGRTVGDEETSKHPSFIDKKILDVFFFRNRLCFTSENNIIMSEVNNVYNFYRTTTLAVLDSDPIDVSVDSIRSISLEYATALNDYVMLFSDKEQFQLSGGASLTPSSVLAQIATAYEFNRNVRPILLDNKVYFAIKRGEYSGILEYSESFASDNTEAFDITAHVSEFIDGDIVQIAGSSTSKMLFVRSSKETRTLYVYNYMFSGRERIQSAWHKWTFNADINSIFCYNDKLYIITDRSPYQEAGESTLWDDETFWDDDTYWIDSEGSTYASYEYIDLEQASVDSDAFIDVGTDQYDSHIKLSEWVMQSGDIKDIRGHLQFKTTKIETSGNSTFELTVYNKSNEKTRTINQTYVVGRRPLIMGKSKDVELTVKSVDSSGFQIDAISHEGRYNVRSRRT